MPMNIGDCFQKMREIFPVRIKLVLSLDSYHSLDNARRFDVEKDVAHISRFIWHNACQNISRRLGHLTIIVLVLNRLYQFLGGLLPDRGVVENEGECSNNLKSKSTKKSSIKHGRKSKSWLLQLSRWLLNAYVCPKQALRKG